MTPSGTSLLGIVKRRAGSEYGWVLRHVRPRARVHAFELEGEESYMRPTPGETGEDILSF